MSQFRQSALDNWRTSGFCLTEVYDFEGVEVLKAEIEADGFLSPLWGDAERRSFIEEPWYEEEIDDEDVPTIETQSGVTVRDIIIRSGD